MLKLTLRYYYKYRCPNFGTASTLVIYSANLFSKFCNGLVVYDRVRSNTGAYTCYIILLTWPQPGTEQENGLSSCDAISSLCTSDV